MPRPLPLTLFDLDHTLLDGDSDVLWCEFLMQRGELDRARELVADAQLLVVLPERLQLAIGRHRDPFPDLARAEIPDDTRGAAGMVRAVPPRQSPPMRRRRNGNRNAVAPVRIGPGSRHVPPLQPFQEGGRTDHSPVRPQLVLCNGIAEPLAHVLG